MANIEDVLRDVNVIKDDGKLNSKLNVILTKHPHIQQLILEATPFLPEDSGFKYRVFCIRNHIKSLPQCHCGNPLKFQGTKLSTYCGISCARRDPVAEQRRRLSNLERYGVEHPVTLPHVKQAREQASLEQYGVGNPFQSTDVQTQIKQRLQEQHGVSNVSQLEHVRSKRRQTFKERYGVDNPFQSDEVKAQIKQTLQRKYGVENISEVEVVRQKRKHTNVERYGNNNPLCDPTIKLKAIATNVERYGDEHPTRNPSVRTKILNTNMERYGDEYPTRNPQVQSKIVNTSRERYGVDRPTQSHISERSLLLLEDRNWLLEQHHVQQRTIMDISKELGVGDTTLGRYFKKHDIEVKFFFRSMGEREVCTFLDECGIEYQINNRSIISPYELDLVIPSRKLAIEYCGLYWHSEQHGKHLNYHKNKWELCNRVGYQLITLYEDEWQQRNIQVRNKLKRLCGIRTADTCYARKCTVVELTSAEKKQFFNDNHIQGTGPGSVTYGLHNDGRLVAAMSFIIQSSKDQVVLNRYATSCNVPGGFSKLLKHAERSNHWKRIVSFADLRWSDGGLYYKNGFTLDKVINPDYYYSLDGKHRKHKFNFRRANLPKLLSQFDPALSERQNCDNNGVLRIWDCGKMRFVKDIP